MSKAVFGKVFYNIKKNLLNTNKKILFVGTPCQVAGLKCYLKNVNTSNLFLVDLICHGVPPITYLKQYLRYLNLSTNIDNVTFRGINNWHFTAYRENNIIYKKHNKEDFYYKSFLNGLFYRENCYHCKYAKKERISDITLGDFWGLGKKIKFDYPVDAGVSVVLLNTEKGNQLFKQIKTNLFVQERTLEEALEGNTQLNHPSIKKAETQLFKNTYKKSGFNKALKILEEEK